MRYNRFEEIPVWQDGVDLTVKVFNATSGRAFRFKGDIANQIQRAALSVPNNIAEGFERGTREEFLHFLYIARASCGEVRTQIYIARDIGFIKNEEFLKIKEKAEFISRLLYRFIESIKVSKYKGLKFKKQKDQKLVEFEKELETIIKKGKNGKI